MAVGREANDSKSDLPLVQWIQTFDLRLQAMSKDLVIVKIFEA